MTAPKLFRKTSRSSEDVRKALQQDWYDTSRRVGIGAFQDATAAECADTVANAIAGKHVPRLHTALNSLVADDAALFNVFRLYGMVAVSVEAGNVNDDETIARLLKTASEYYERLRDGVRDHNDTVALAELFTPLIPAMLAIVEEAAKHRGGA